MSEEIKVFTYKDIEEAKKYIGKQGYFFDTFRFSENPDQGRIEILQSVEDVSYPFGKANSGRCQFFLPLEPLKEPEYEPYTFEDAKEFRDLWVYTDKETRDRIGAVIRSGVYFGPNEFLTFENLLHYTKEDGTPFGKLKK